MPGPEQHRDEAEDERLLHRLLFFSDAVFAIVLTLLVLELRPPKAEDSVGIARALAEMIGHFVSFGASFALVGVFWVAHMSTLRKLARFDWPTAIVNLVLLGFVSLMPFASSLLGEARFGLVAWRFYSWVLVATSLTMMALVLTMYRNGGVWAGGASARERNYRLVRAASPGVAFALALVLAQAGLLELSRFCPVLILVQIRVADMVFKPRAPKVEDVS